MYPPFQGPEVLIYTPCSAVPQLQRTCLLGLQGKVQTQGHGLYVRHPLNLRRYSGSISCQTHSRRLQEPVLLLVLQGSSQHPGKFKASILPYSGRFSSWASQPQLKNRLSVTGHSVPINLQPRPQEGLLRARYCSTDTVHGLERRKSRAVQEMQQYMKGRTGLIKWSSSEGLCPGPVCLSAHSTLLPNFFLSS